MPRMKDKIKNLFSFIHRAWCGGIYGKIGVLLLLFCLFVFARFFWGQVNVRKFVSNIWLLSAEQKELAMYQEELNRINHHIDLINQPSPDYIEELGLKALNIGDAKYRVLKI